MKLFHIQALIPSTYLFEAMTHLENCKAYNVEVRTAGARKEEEKKSRFSKAGERMYFATAQALPEHGTFNRGTVKAAIVSVGGNANSIGSCIDSMLHARLIKKVGRDQYRRLAAKVEDAA